MVLIKRERRNSKIDYDYWNEVQRSHISSQNERENRKGITKRIEELLEEH
jgi:hypothetical protein